jgi:hypothetical protein
MEAQPDTDGLSGLAQPFLSKWKAAIQICDLGPML